MKFKMAENSLFAMLLRSPWWISLAIAAALSAIAMALLPVDYRIAGALSSFPFVIIAILAARRQLQLPSEARVELTVQAVRALAWPAFAELLERAFQRDGYTVQRGSSPAVDFVLERGGRTMLVSARRWKSARTGLEPLRALQDARLAGDALDALCIGLGELSENAKPFAAQHRIAIWQAAELARALRDMPLGTPKAR